MPKIIHQKLKENFSSDILRSSTAHPFPVHLVKQNEVEHNNINCNLT